MVLSVGGTARIDINCESIQVLYCATTMFLNRKQRSFSSLKLTRRGPIGVSALRLQQFNLRPSP